MLRVFNKYNFLNSAVLFWMLILLAASPLPAQDQEDFLLEKIEPEDKINKSKWQKSAVKYDYSKEKIKEKKEEPKPEEEIKKTEKKDEAPLLSPTMQELLKYSLFAVVILILVIIGYKLIAGGTIFGNRKIVKDKVYTLENLEENLQEVNVNSFLNDAIAANDYRLAVRLYYLSVLKALSLSGTIVWKKDKTNGSYLREMKNNPFYEEFSKCTGIYEYVWFNENGRFSSNDFEAVTPLFKNLLSKTEKQALTSTQRQDAEK